MDTYPDAVTPMVTQTPLDERSVAATSSADAPVIPLTESSSGQ